MSVAWFEKLPVLNSAIVALEPLSLIHLKDLQSAASGADCWEYEHSLVPRPGELETYVEDALAEKETGEGTHLLCAKLTPEYCR